MRVKPLRCLPIVLAALVVTVGCPGEISAAQPFVPADDAEVLERLALSPLDANVRQVQALRQQLAKQPDNLALATRLGWMYVEQGRTLSDPRSYGHAQGVLAPWWNAAQPPLPVLVLRATIRQHDHDFAKALDDLSLALRIDPANAQAWLTRAVVLQVRGEYAAARDSCMQVLPLAKPLVAVTCLSSVGSLTGAAPKSYEMLQHALRQATDADPGSRRWALGTLAEIAARRDETTRAEAHFKQALGLGGRDDYLLGAYADFLLDQGRPGLAAELLKDSTRADALLLRLALAEQRLGSAELGTHVQMLRDRFAAARLRGDVAHRREEARFALHLLNQPAAALRLAQDNWAVQREPWDARLLLESALAASNRGAAQPVLDFVDQAGLEDVQLARLRRSLEAGPRQSRSTVAFHAAHPQRRLKTCAYSPPWRAPHGCRRRSLACAHGCRPSVDDFAVPLSLEARP